MVMVFVCENLTNVTEVNKALEVYANKALHNSTNKYTKVHNRIIDGHNGILIESGKNSTDPRMIYLGFYCLDEVGGFARKLVVMVSSLSWNDGAELLMDTVHVEELPKKVGSWLLIQPQGAVVQIDANPVKILEKQFGARSVDKNNDAYMVTVPGQVSAMLPESLGYSGTKIVEKDNTTNITIIASPESVITNYLRKSLDADVMIVGESPILYEIRTNVTRDSLNALLAPIGGSIPQVDDAFAEGVTQETMDDTRRVLYSKFVRLGFNESKIVILSNKSLAIYLADLDLATAQDIAAKPGKFEIRIRTENNQSMLVLYGDAVESVDTPKGDRNGEWGIPFALSKEGARIFQKAVIDAGATRNPEAHPISMYLDKDEIFSAPLSPELGESIQKTPIRSLEARVGDKWWNARDLYIHLKGGAIPISFKVIWAGKAPIDYYEKLALT
jgi:preprotein translocase subunit SecD